LVEGRLAERATEEKMHILSSEFQYIVPISKEKMTEGYEYSYLLDQMADFAIVRHQTAD